MDTIGQAFDIELEECNLLENWNLSGLNIFNANIPRDLVDHDIAKRLATQGFLDKFTVPTGKTISYVKAGVRAGIYDTKQPIVEAVASEIGKLLGFDVAPTDLWIIDRSLFDIREVQESEFSEEFDEGEPLYNPTVVTRAKTFSSALHRSGKVLVGVSPSYITPGYMFSHCQKEFGFVTEEILYSRISSKGENVVARVQQMMMFDFLIDNPDRHHKNFGFLSNTKGDHEIFAPLIDHGHGLLAGRILDDPDDSVYVDHAVGHETTFLNLMNCVEKFVDLESVKYIDFSVPVEQLLTVVDKYASLLGGGRRVRLMKHILETRWKYCQGRYGT